jgi:hypothetical protein
MKVDGLRKRADWPPYRTAYYAKQRAIRFSRRMLGK